MFSEVSVRLSTGEDVVSCPGPAWEDGVCPVLVLARGDTLNRPSWGDEEGEGTL